MTRLLRVIKKNPVVFAALFAAAVTSIIVPPDREYIGYFDFKTLTCLFCTLATVGALKNIKFFRIIAEKIVCVFKKTRTAVIALVYITFIGSMLIANDMALITFLPLGYFVLSSTGNKKHMAFTFIMQNIAANLGGMLTPFGNPQNLYLYSYFDIPTAEFMGIMLIPFLVSVTLITLCCIHLPGKEMVLEKPLSIKLNKKRTAVYLALFFFSIAIVFKTIPYYWGLIVIPSALLVLDRRALKKVDYPLLLTFCAFFVFSGNLARIPAVDAVASRFMDWSPLMSGVISCQFISNVPSAILLSKFTENYRELLVAVNIGGTGTLISSLASLITFREYSRHFPKKRLSYLKQFTLYNFGILAVLVMVCILFI